MHKNILQFLIEKKLKTIPARNLQQQIRKSLSLDEKRCKVEAYLEFRYVMIQRNISFYRSWIFTAVLNLFVIVKFVYRWTRFR